MYAHTISSIQQIGVGTSDFKTSWEWYKAVFGFDVKILEDDTIAERMLPYTGGKPQKRHAGIAVNLQGGGGLEVWQYSERTPKKPLFRIAVGDTGIFAAKIKCRDVQKFHQELKDKLVKCSSISADPAGAPCFFVEDPFGNTFQIIQRKDIFIDEDKLCGGIAGALIGVTDIERSIKFYRDILGYDLILYDVDGVFDDWSIMPSSGERYRRVLLGKSERPVGPFSKLLGTNTIELVQALDHTPRKIYQGRFWGDPGFIQICYDVQGMDSLKEFCRDKGSPFTVDSCPDGERFNMGKASGRFTYIEDPDGTLIEFVETKQIPLIGKIRIDVLGRREPLPRILFKLMKLI